SPRNGESHLEHKFRTWRIDPPVCSQLSGPRQNAAHQPEPRSGRATRASPCGLSRQEAHRAATASLEPLTWFQGIRARIIPIPHVAVIPANTSPAPTNAEIPIKYG